MPRRLDRYDNVSKMDLVSYSSVPDPYYTSRNNEQFPSLSLSCSITLQNATQTQFFLYICLSAHSLALTHLTILDRRPFLKPGITPLSSLLLHSAESFQE